MSADAELAATTTRQAWSRPPIELDFSVVMFTASGLLVRYLKVFEKSGYNSVKWVRYLSKANGSYQIRVSRKETRRVGEVRVCAPRAPARPLPSAAS